MARKLLILLVSLVACGDRGAKEQPSSATSTQNSARAPAGTSSASAAALTSNAPPTALSAAPSASAAAPTSHECPDDMVLVTGDYCPDVEQQCLKHHEEYAHDRAKQVKAAAEGRKYKSTVSERCLEYAPSVCKSKERRKLSFCVDRYEYPNKKGELPAFLISWTDAKKTCESLGKRLCTEDEFNFACEGPDMLPYTYGLVRDPTKCSIDKPYIKREKKLYPYERCMKKPACKEHLAKLDQRVPAGSMPECVSPFGVFDLNGNINEWVELPGKQYPDRSGLKGGWWGPVRGRCRPTVDFHKEDDYGYEEGFRCCRDVGG
ncbi:MAG: SUMF1/EgtB/PvdO family nonheme iron enzyme [Polyangiaceae bacterium]